MDLKELNNFNKDSLVSNLGIEITEFNGDMIKGTMPVDSRTVQPFRILHGGATAALAETLGSFGSHMNIDTDKCYAVGLELNCNHLKSVTEGMITGVGRLIHKGRKTHVWNIDFNDDDKRLIATSRLTVMILDKK